MQFSVLDAPYFWPYFVAKSSLGRSIRRYTPWVWRKDFGSHLVVFRCLDWQLKIVDKKAIECLRHIVQITSVGIVMESVRLSVNFWNQTRAFDLFRDGSFENGGFDGAVHFALIAILNNWTSISCFSPKSCFLTQIDSNEKLSFDVQLSVESKYGLKQYIPFSEHSYISEKRGFILEVGQKVSNSHQIGPGKYQLQLSKKHVFENTSILREYTCPTFYIPESKSTAHFAS